MGAPSTNTLILVGGLFLLIFAGIVLVMWIDRWRHREDVPICPPEDQLAQFEKLFENGELSREEFERIKRSLEHAKSGSHGAPPTSEEQHSALPPSADGK